MKQVAVSRREFIRRTARAAISSAALSIIPRRLIGWPLKVTVSEITGFNWKFYWSGKTYLKP